MRNLIKFVPFAIAAIILAGCETAGDTQDTSSTDTTQGSSTTATTTTDTTTTDTSSASTSGTGSSTSSQMNPLDDPTSILSQRVIYFEFDKSNVLAEYQAVVEAHGKYLSENPDTSVVLEGHADERGTREYNIALGARRSKAVQQMLNFQGLRLDQTSTMSFGEEKPAAMGHDEQSWGKNRRVEIVYQ